MRDDRERLLDILEAIQRIDKYAALGRDRFESDELVQSWVLRHLQIIGEAVRGLSDDLRQQHSEVPWSQIVGMRHILVHHYFDIDLDVVWVVVAAQLPELQRQIETIVKGLGNAGEPD